MSTEVEPLSIRLLGRFEVWRNGSQIVAQDWPRRKPRWLFALLLSKPGAVFSYDLLIEALFASSDPEKARRNLYSLASQLRRTLEPNLPRAADSTFILRRGEGYCFNTDAPYSLDTEELARLIRHARWCQAADRLGEARSYYQQAMDLYKGDYLPENRYDEWTLEIRDDCARMYVEALSGLADCHAAAGDFAAAIALCQRLIRAEPHSERGFRKKMYFHYCAGHRVEAEETFIECEEALREYLDAEPSAELRDLHDQISAGAAPEISRWVPNNLPHPVTPFVGRAEAIGRIQEALRKNRLLTLVGPGGIGKTRLALQVGSESLQSFADGIWFSDLSTISDPEEVVNRVAGSLAVVTSGDQPRIELLADHLRSRNLLLILDTCEHVLEDCSPIVDVLLKSSPNLKILATSREALGVPGEVVWEVPPLASPERETTPSRLASLDAVRLLVARIQLRLPSFSLSQVNASLIARLCRSLDGMPLAIELAASRAKATPLKELVRQAENATMVTGWESRTGDPRHRSLDASIGWSYETLTPNEQRLLRGASVFRGGFDLVAAEEVLATGGNPSFEVCQQLAGLVAKSLLEFDASPSEGRYRMLHTIRAFAAQRAMETNEIDGLRCRHLEYFVSFVERAGSELLGPLQGPWLSRLDTNLENVRDAFHWAVETGQVEESLTLASKLTRYWVTRGRHQEGLQWLDVALNAGAAAARSRAVALNRRAWLRQHARPDFRKEAQAELDRVREDLLEACTLFEQLNDRVEWARSRLLIGNAAYLTEDMTQAQSIYQEVLHINREIGNRHGEAASLAMLGRISLREGDDESALLLFQQALRIAREIEDLGKVQGLLRDMSTIHERKRNHKAAWKLKEEGLALAREIGDEGQELVMLVMLAIDAGSVPELHLEPDVAERYWDRALQLAAETPSAHAEPYVLTNRAEYLLRTDRLGEAKTVLARALPLALDRGQSLYASYGALLLAEVACRGGDTNSGLVLLGALRSGSFDITSRPHMCSLDKNITALARAALGEQEIEKHLRTGAEYDLRTAVLLALE